MHASGNLDGNPLHLDQLEIVEMLHIAGNPVLGLNVVIDDQRQLSFVSYGDIVASHESAVDYVRQFAVVPVCSRVQPSSLTGPPAEEG